jgi:CDP-diacylglycerol--serine O-phosphatidyltransferase
MRSPLDAFHWRNLLTYASVVCATIAVAGALASNGALAGAAIAAAVMADTFDGRFARLFNADVTRRQIGIELDSLADAIAFGLAPVVCALALSKPHEPSSGVIAVWVAGSLYSAGAITRLAFFNVNAHAATPHEFIGIPVPVAALIWSSLLLVHPSTFATVAVLLACAMAMIAPLRISRPTGLGLALFTCWPLAAALGHLLVGNG